MTNHSLWHCWNVPLLPKATSRSLAKRVTVWKRCEASVIPRPISCSGCGDARHEWNRGCQAVENCRRTGGRFHHCLQPLRRRRHRYLLKPIKASRVRESVQRCKARLSLRASTGPREAPKQPVAMLHVSIGMGTFTFHRCVKVGEERLSLRRIRSAPINRPSSVASSRREGWLVALAHGQAPGLFSRHLPTELQSPPAPRTESSATAVRSRHQRRAPGSCLASAMGGRARLDLRNCGRPDHPGADLSLLLRVPRTRTRHSPYAVSQCSPYPSQFLGSIYNRS